MHDSVCCGRRFRIFNIIDEPTRECLAIEVDTSLPAQRLVSVIEQLKAERHQAGLDDGPELVLSAIADRCETHGVNVVYIQGGKPQ